MTRLRHISVWVLLAAFAAGGTVGPVVHQVQHAAEQAAAAAAPCHSAAVHNSDVPLWTEGVPSLDAPECILCARRLLVVPPAPAPTPAPTPTQSIQVATPSSVASVQTGTHQFIRGPPSRLGDRLA